MKKFLNLVAIFFIWLLYFFIWLLYEFLGENMLLYYWYLGWNKHFRITFSKHRLPKATTNARVAEFKIDLQPRVSNVHIMHNIDIHTHYHHNSRDNHYTYSSSRRCPKSKDHKRLRFDSWIDRKLEGLHYQDIHPRYCQTSNIRKNWDNQDGRWVSPRGGLVFHWP